MTDFLYCEIFSSYETLLLYQKLLRSSLSYTIHGTNERVIYQPASLCTSELLEVPSFSCVLSFA